MERTHIDIHKTESYDYNWFYLLTWWSHKWMIVCIFIDLVDITNLLEQFTFVDLCGLSGS